MPRRKEQLHVIGRPYHISNRAVEGREIFGSKEDCSRFLFQMYAANIGSPAPNMHRADIHEIAQKLFKGEDIAKDFVRVEHPPLVEFFSFALLRDRYHLGIVPTVKEGISRYMQKLNLGFAKYYNLKYGRRGSLFETRFHASSVRTPQHLKSLAHHINIKSILDVYQPDWQTKGLNDHDEAVRFLYEYPYSSFPDIFRGRESAFIPVSARSELRKFIKIKGEKKEIVEIANDYILRQDSIDIR
ncbi:MAG: hypothetical protein HYW97_01700 [Candidatus Wildermuthbacteria bacterium]|nr:hypothetical protein [Candidatus Wildermuthbacteria bacterium]